MGAIAKSVIFDFADGYGGSTIGIRSIDFYLDTNLISLSPSDFTAYATSSSSAIPQYAFDTSLSKTGSWTGTSWLSSGSNTNQRLIIVFDDEQYFDSIVINNLHDSGSNTSYGVKTTEITATSDSYTNTTYGATVTNSTDLWSGTLDEHIASDAVDDQTIDLANDIAFSMPLLNFDGYGWLGDAGLIPIWPSLDVSIDGTFHTPGIITDLPILSASITGTFTPRVVSMEFDLPALTFSGSATTNKIDVIFDLPVFTSKLYSGSHITETLPSLLFTGEVEAIRSGNINFTLPLLESSFTSGSQIKTTFPRLNIELNGNSIDAESIITSSLAFFIPSLSCAIQGNSSFNGDIAVNLPEFICEIKTQNLQDQILRHIRGAIR